MGILMAVPPRRQSGRSSRFIGNRCASCDAPLRDALAWLCPSCRAHQRLAVVLEQVRRDLR
jgi:hypothetical protein